MALDCQCPDLICTHARTGGLTTARVGLENTVSFFKTPSYAEQIQQLPCLPAKPLSSFKRLPPILNGTKFQCRCIFEKPCDQIGEACNQGTKQAKSNASKLPLSYGIVNYIAGECYKSLFVLWFNLTCERHLLKKA